MDLDFETIQLIQQEFQNDFNSSLQENISDSFIARSLQEQFKQSPDRSYGDLVYDKKKKNRDATRSLVDPSWEIIDPTPDIHVLFIAFNSKFFWGKLESVCVSWSKRMKRCAGICSYQGRGGLCSITLSEPLLKLRPRKDLIETLLHEMIHAYLFVTHNNRDRDGHGPEFHKHMYRINKEAGTNITVYHDFHDEVELYLTHWWRCDGPCQKWKPYFGIVRRSSNRAPGPYDRWWGQHARSCGGTFIKIKSPEPKVKESKTTKNNKPVNDIRKFISNSGYSGSTSSTSNKVNPKSNKNTNIHSVHKPSSSLSTSVTVPSKTNNIHGFTNAASQTSVKGATKVNSNTIVVTKKPTTNTQGGKTGNSTNSVTSLRDDPIDKTKNIRQENSIDYSVVRNHWLNKFSNSEIKRDTQTNISNKRKAPDSILVPAKSTKFSEISSQDSLNCESAACPVCNVSYPIEELNRHLDICLSEQKKDTKECVVCSKEVEESEYEQHVNECLDRNFGNSETPENTQTKTDVIVIDDDSFDVDSFVCSICGNQVIVENIDEHSKICKNRAECPECGKKLDPSRFDVHLAACLLKKFDQMENELDNGQNMANNSENTKTEMITCLVCGKYILKNNLYSHLDECVKEVFDKDEKETDEVEDEDHKLYNCPFCLKLISEVDMSDHIDICLKTNGDEEAEKNKTLFLKEID